MQFEEQYKKLIQRIFEEGEINLASKGPNREVIGAIINIDPLEVPLLSGRQMHYEGLVGELKGFLNNVQTDEEFKKLGCNFWGAWTANGVDYSRLLHNFNGVNQLEKVIDSLKKKPSSRKHVISLWEPGSPALQPPCVMHYQWLVQNGRLHMIWSQRSADVMIGLASDMFSAWLFNQLMALATGYRAGNVQLQIGSAHIYEVHNVVEYLNRPILSNEVEYELHYTSIYDWDFKLLRYEHAPSIRYELCI